MPRSETRPPGAAENTVGEEVRFFLRVALFVLVVGAIYWFVSYEAAGTALLVFAGLAATFFIAHIALHVRATRVAVAPAAGSPLGRLVGAVNRVVGVDERPMEEAETPLAATDQLFPTASAWPVIGALAALLVGLGIIYGPWLTLPGIALAVAAVWGWLTQLDPRPAAATETVGALADGWADAGWTDAERSDVDEAEAPAVQPRFIGSASEAMLVAQPGDILLFHRPRFSLFTWLVELLNHSRWHHAALALPGGWMVEASSRGVRRTFISASPDLVAVVPFEYRDAAQRDYMLAFARGRIGRPYGPIGALLWRINAILIDLGISILRGDRVLPGQLVAEALARTRRVIGPDPARVSPGDIAEMLGLPRR